MTIFEKYVILKRKDSDTVIICYKEDISDILQNNIDVLSEVPFDKWDLGDKLTIVSNELENNNYHIASELIVNMFHMIKEEERNNFLELVISEYKL